jgi:large subunit ribosomal protein L1
LVSALFNLDFKIMGKVKPRLLGLEEVEKKQKQEQKEKAAQRKTNKQHKIRAQGLKGGERMTEVEVKKGDLEKMEKAKKILGAKKSFDRRSLGKGGPKTPKIKPRGKRYQEAKKLVDSNKYYSLKEAVNLLKKMELAKFDQSVELHFVVDETGLKGEIDLPYSTGKIVKVKVVDDKVLADLEKGKIEFDILVTHPSFMPKLAKFAKVLGPRGLMPNPKAGTISSNPPQVVKKFEKGLLRWKTEAKFPLIHQMIGKISYDEKNLVTNAEKFLEAVGKAHIKKALIKTTMSPAIKIAI